MRSKIQEKVLNVLYKALQPLVHLFLEVGIGHREFAEVAKRAYVDVATKKYGIRGRKTNISRVAVMTGLTRKEVKRIRDAEKGSETDLVKPIPANSVLFRWHTDEEFLGADRQPLPLKFSGPEVSFEQLVKKYAGDIPPGALRTELLRSGAIEIEDSGKLVVRRREFRVIDNEDRLIRALQRLLASAIGNVAHNNLQDVRDKSSYVPWPEYLVEVSNVDESRLSKIREITESQLVTAAQHIDDNLVEFDRLGELPHGAPSGKTVLVGLYYSEID